MRDLFGELTEGFHALSDHRHVAVSFGLSWWGGSACKPLIP